MKTIKNEKGITLVEILAAVTILGIVFIGFMTAFPQMTKFNAQTEVKLETMNMARVELSLIKEGEFLLNPDDPFFEVTSRDCVLTLNYEKLVDSEFYNFEVQYHIVPDLGVYEPEEENAVRLNAVQIKVDKENTAHSETFGYLENYRMPERYLGSCSGEGSG